MERNEYNIVQKWLKICSLIAFLIIVVLLSPVQAHITSISVESIALERNPVVGNSPVFQNYILIKIDNAVGTIILFPGGNGKVGVGDGQLSIGVANFLVQSRFYFAAEGFNVVIMDAATDFWQLSNGLFGQRTSAAHLSDIYSVINDLPVKIEETGPICLVGTSRGTISVGAYAADGPPDSIDCIVLTSSVTLSGWAPFNTDNLLDNVNLEAITAPAYLVAHENDLCYSTPPSDVLVLESRLKVGSPKVKSKYFNGGTTTLTNECSPLAAHGFFGIEPKVVQDIGKWIRKTIIN